MTGPEEPLPQAAPLQKGCLLFALPEEAWSFQKRRRVPESRVIVSSSGAGAQNAARAATQLFAAHPDAIKYLLICGFAGGLAQGVRPETLVLADRVMDESEDAHTPATIYSADSDLLCAAESVRLSGLSLRRGTLVTAARVLLSPEEKRALARRTGALAVDMETAGAERVAQAHGIPWLAVRAITDGPEDAMPLDFNALADPDGNVYTGPVLHATLLRPWKIPALARLGLRSARAARNLAAFLETFLQTLPEERE